MINGTVNISTFSHMILIAWICLPYPKVSLIPLVTNEWLPNTSTRVVAVLKVFRKYKNEL